MVTIYWLKHRVIDILVERQTILQKLRHESGHKRKEDESSQKKENVYTKGLQISIDGMMGNQR